MADLPAITSFAGPLPTGFSPPDACTAISQNVDGIIGLDFASTCLPSGFDSATDFYYSPGTGCPTGYTALDSCRRSTGTETTTMTCCPVRGELTMKCVDDPLALSNAWVNQQCTWSAGDTETVILVTSTDGTDSSTLASTMSGADGFNAYGLKMVHEPSDLTTSTPTTSAAEGASTQTSSSGDGDDSSSGLSTGGIAAIAVVIPVVVIAALIGAYFWYRRRKQRYGAVGAVENELPADKPAPSELVADSTGYSQRPSEAYGSETMPQEMPAPMEPQELPADASFTISAEKGLRGTDHAS